MVIWQLLNKEKIEVVADAEIHPRKPEFVSAVLSISMGKGRRKRINKIKAKAKASKQVAAGPANVNDLPDELVDAVLLNLGSSPLHLIRAAATCRRWRHAIADPGFLARSRALHGAPPVAGRYYVTDKLPPNSTMGRCSRPAKKPAAFVPSSPAVVDAGHFSLDFLYDPQHSRRREIVDSHGSLLLLTSRPSSGSRRSWWPDFIVCEPVSRRYQGIVRPADLSHLPLLGAILLDCVGSGADAMSNFRVLCVLYQLCRPQACVFTPGSDGGWRIYWHTVDDDDDVEFPATETIRFNFAGRFGGKVYWGMGNNSVLVLDESTLKFSLVRGFSSQSGWTSFRVVGGVDGGDKVRVVRIDGHGLKVFGQVPDSGKWVIESSISLRDATANLPGWEQWLFQQPAKIVTADDTFVVLTPEEKTWIFSVDLETMEVDNKHVRNREVRRSYPCALPWPPILQACVNHGDATGKRRHKTAPRIP